MTTAELALWCDGDLDNASALYTALRAHKRLLSPERRLWAFAPCCWKREAIPSRCYVVAAPPSRATALLAALRAWGGRRG